SMLAKRDEPQTVVRASSPQPTLPPVTPAPSEKPTPEPTVPIETTPPTLAPEATAMPVAPGAPKAKPKATHARNVLSAAHVAAAVAAPAQPAPERTVSRQASSAPASATTLAPRSTDAPSSADDADSEFAKLAAGVVRQYIAAVARGDVPSAYGALGQSVPDTADLPEIGVIDGNTRIRHVEARGSGDAAAVNVDMQGRSGLFFGQYTVHKTPSGAAVIVQHTLVKP
ncbi:MAG: hypothetical protein M3R53_06620, partial [Candidatus Eremiobacteraeota bacterium]|nr:hypothetical protein [Candidatus Eremiobacteraeota bacterium]